MDSNMEQDKSKTLERHRNSFKRPRNFQNSDEDGNFDPVKELEEDKCDPEAWKTLNRCFRQVQSVLDRNRVLIQLVNQNHQSLVHDKLLKNAAIIREINGNIAKVASLYSDLSVNFSALLHHQHDLTASASAASASGSGSSSSSSSNKDQVNNNDDDDDNNNNELKS